MSQQSESRNAATSPHIVTATSNIGVLEGKHVVLCVTGSIAAYKAVILLRLLRQEGARVTPLLTRSARQFVGQATFSGLSGEVVRDDFFAEGLAGELHVDLATNSDLIMVAPATADVLARLAQGRADDLLCATVLCSRSPVLIAPAMHPNMWEHPATQRNVQSLEKLPNIRVVGPEHGPVASGELGVGRMSEPEQLLDEALCSLTDHDLSGRALVVTAGPTLEDLDPVRFVGNRSSGKMGFAIARRAAARGAEVTLVTGPVDLPTPASVERVNVRSAVAMRGAVWQALGPDLARADALIMAAAVSDYRPAETRASKLKREGDRVNLQLLANPDILAEVGAARQLKLPVLVGFAVEADEEPKVANYARGKLESKKVDMVVANHARDSFGREDNRALLVTPGDIVSLGFLPKRVLAERILDWVRASIEERC